MIVHRLAKAAYVTPDGEGARLYGGRWNSPGRPMVYTAASASLALLEVLVHLDLPPDLLPVDYHLVILDIPDAAAMQSLEAAPAETADCIRLGDEFLEAGNALSLSVPSVIVPQERNLLINPRHPDAAGIRTVQIQSFLIDPRLVN